MTSAAPELPGSEIVNVGLSDLARGERSAAALVVSIGAPRLRQLGFDVMCPIDDAEHACSPTSWSNERPGLMVT